MTLLTDLFTIVDRNFNKKGAFGQILLVKRNDTDTECVAKIPLNNKNHSSDVLKNEIRILRRFTSSRVPRLIDFSLSKPMYFVMPRFDFTLQEVIDSSEKINNKRLIAISLQCMRALETVHCKKIIHRDLKPSNIMFDKKRKSVVIIDFGLSKVLKDSDKKKKKKAFIGNKKYSSIAAMLKKPVDYKDDLQNLIFVLISCRVNLPWARLKSTKKEDKFEKILKLKSEFGAGTGAGARAGAVPDPVMRAFCKILDYTKSDRWKKNERVNYKSVRNCLKQVK